MAKRIEPAVRFAAFLVKGEVPPGHNTPCIEWSGARTRAGYGIFMLGREQGVVYTHRHAMALAGIEGEGSVLHSCDNPPCCNVDHLRWGTVLENAADAMERGAILLGEKHPRSVLTENQVLEARARHVAGEQVAAIAKDLGVKRGTLFPAVSWKDMETSP